MVILYYTPVVGINAYQTQNFSLSLGGWDTLMRRSNSFPIRPAPGPSVPRRCHSSSRNRLIIVLLVHLLSFCSIIERSIKEPARSGVSAPPAAIFVFSQRCCGGFHFKERGLLVVALSPSDRPACTPGAHL